MSRLEIIFPTVAWYFLKRSVAKKASNAAALSHASNRRTWFGSFCETAILSWRQPGSFTAAAPSSLIAVRYLSISAGTMSYSTTRMWRGPDCAVACSPRIGNSHAATPSAIARLLIATDFNIGFPPFADVRSSACLLLSHLGPPSSVMNERRFRLRIQLPRQGPPRKNCASLRALRDFDPANVGLGSSRAISIAPDRQFTSASPQKRTQIQGVGLHRKGCQPRHAHPASERRITRDGDAMHTPPLARIIVERAMLGAAVVPYRQRTNLPAESAGKLRLHGMRHQKIENRPRLGALEPLERLRVIAYVERFAAG